MNTNGLCYWLMDKGIAKEFFQKEVQFTKRNPVIELPFGMFFESTAEALRRRSIYAEFFNYSNVCSTQPALMRHFNQNLQNFKQEKGESGSIQTDYRKMMKPGFETAITEILFGTEEQIELNGQPVIRSLIDLLETYFQLYQDPMFLLTYGYSYKIGMSAESRRLKKIEKQCLDKMKEVYWLRKAQYLKAEEVKGKNALDLIVRHNLEAEAHNKEEEVIDIDTIAKDLILLLFGGNDTSIQVSSCIASILSQKREIQSRLREEIQACM
jgi:cytochrome P450